VESFETILIAFACSRLIFAGQYMTSESICSYILRLIAEFSGLAGMAGETEHTRTYLDYHLPSDQWRIITGSYGATRPKYFHGDNQSQSPRRITQEGLMGRYVPSMLP